MGRRRTFLVLILLQVVVLAGCAYTRPRDIGRVDRSPLTDGVYEGSFQEGPIRTEVRVTVTGQKITGIELVRHRNWRGGKAEAVVIERIIEEQSTRVDAVSGATQSSYVIMNAVQSALDKAKK